MGMAGGAMAMGAAHTAQNSAMNQANAAVAQAGAMSDIDAANKMFDAVASIARNEARLNVARAGLSAIKSASAPIM